ncbi:hypothetical protein [Dechloromonas denitrificans]|uniref:hypothetical protein n=1 Tax=Dechloromonas denitrificans TaxID=281362 RepID=UPI000AE15986|nr:hypothetical protein [Dechloromonas denitrificans]
MRQTSIGTFLFPVVEVLDFAGPYEVFTTATQGLGHRLGSVQLGISQRCFGRRRGVLGFERLVPLSAFCALPATLEHSFNATGFDRQFAHFETSSGQLDNTEIIGLAE